MKKRLHALFKGSVQGVGFRFTTESLARRLSVSGWVKNLSSGDVELVAEGEQTSLLELLEALEQEFSGYIRQKNVTWEQATGEFKDFGIKFDRNA